ncbi:MAG: amino acid ABC transporter permease, partial [Exiguobacterium sp.]|nr:amino acid ABC transporter permease [Exiguobacterium sp.]
MNELITTVIDNRSVYLEAVQLTLIASVLSILLALALGLIIALLHSSPIKIVRLFTRTYISFFRGT